ncbi:MAG TPA: DNA gyrase inhibitor YacG [Methylophilaceae bacterium]
MVTCPQCKQTSEYSTDNPYRPFCSERCKLIDLGQWADENYRIPEPIKPDDLLEE